jgi:hypothetical protein
MKQELHFLSPVMGDCLTDKAGVRTNEGLAVTVRVAAVAGGTVTVNGVLATPREAYYEAVVVLTAYRNELIARTADGGEVSATVFWLPRATDAYRLSLDDNIWCLQDIARHQDTYKSIFDNPYFGMYRDFHTRFGTKVNANIYLECPEHGGFHLSDMPDKFKREWEQNADWLHLSFHAKANLPDAPYVDTDYHRILADYNAVMGEIRRFAGEAVTSAETTVHWGECTAEGVRALRDQGIRTLAGYLCLDRRGKPMVSYYLTPDEIHHTDRYGIWHDRRTDMIFSKIDVVLNSHTPARIVEILEEQYAAHPEKGFWEFLIHEQYFYPDYVNYLPDYRERIEAALRWAEEKGLRPAFLSETHLEA